MLVGLAACTAGQNEAQNYLRVPNLAIQTEYLQFFGWSWSAGMLANTWINRCAGATKAIMSVPLLVGPQSGSPVDGASGSGQTTSPQNPSNVTTPTTMTLTDVAAGVWDSLYTQAFQTIATVRPDCILRIGWEQYGNGWYPWNGVGLISQYAAAYKHLVTLARSVSASFQFDWNGNVAYVAYDPVAAYALIGDAYVDFMTCDMYSATPYNGAAGFNAYRDAVLTQAVNFAVSRGKKFGFTEYGLFYAGFSSGVGDDPAWLKNMYYWLRQNQANIAYACFFQNYTGGPTTDGGGCLQRNPQCASLFTSLFASWARELAGETSHRFISSGVNRLRVK